MATTGTCKVGTLNLLVNASEGSTVLGLELRILCIEAKTL